MESRPPLRSARCTCTFSKAYGPDLRLAVVSGTTELVKRLQSWRNFGVSWTSRILQDAVAWMLSDAPTQQRIQQAKAMPRAVSLAALGGAGWYRKIATA